MNPDGVAASMITASNGSGDLAPPRTRVPHISLVFREMWDSTALAPNSQHQTEVGGRGKSADD